MPITTRLHKLFEDDTDRAETYFHQWRKPSKRDARAAEETETQPAGEAPIPAAVVR